MYIVCVCGLGMGSSLILKMTVDKALKELGCGGHEIEHWDAGTVSSKLVGKGSKSAEDMKLPEGLKFFKDTSMSIAIVMFVFYMLVVILAGPESVGAYSGGTNYLIYGLLKALGFTAGVAGIMGNALGGRRGAMAAGFTYGLELIVFSGFTYKLFGHFASVGAEGTGHDCIDAMAVMTAMYKPVVGIIIIVAVFILACVLEARRQKNLAAAGKKQDSLSTFRGGVRIVAAAPSAYNERSRLCILRSASCAGSSRRLKRPWRCSCSRGTRPGRSWMR